MVPRSQWRLGRITEIYPDDNGLVRQVSVKTETSEVKRPIHKLCLVVPANPEEAIRKDCDDPATSFNSQNLY